MKNKKIDISSKLKDKKRKTNDDLFKQSENIKLIDKTIKQHNKILHNFKDNELNTFRPNLLTWYNNNRRRLPWRGDPPPYISTLDHTKTKSNNHLYKNENKDDNKKKTQSSLLSFFSMNPKLDKNKNNNHNSNVDCVSNMNGNNIQKDLITDSEEKPENKSNQDMNNTTEIIKEENMDLINSSQRRTVSAYETWVSEIMLQQTRVDTVIDYFNKWMKEFPTIKDLANATPEQVNSIWAGLGYYKRARMLQDGANFVLKNLNGEIPNSIDTLLSIPGIGPYTAGAIASIAYNKPVPLVDGNVLRVFSRVRKIKASPKDKKFIDYAWNTAKILVDKDSPGDFNQGLMELGATICTPQNPNCQICPLKNICLAYLEENEQKNKNYEFIEKKENSSSNCLTNKIKINDNEICTICDLEEIMNPSLGVTQYPLKAKKTMSRNEVINVVIIAYKYKDINNNKDTYSYLMSKRPSTGLLANQWEFLCFKVKDGTVIDPYKIRKMFIKDKLNTIYDLHLNINKENKIIIKENDLGEMIHIFSHIKHYMGIQYIEIIDNNINQINEWKDKFKLKNNHLNILKWMNEDEMNKVGMTTGMKKVYKLFLKNKNIKVEN